MTLSNIQPGTLVTPVFRISFHDPREPIDIQHYWQPGEPAPVAGGISGSDVDKYSKRVDPWVPVVLDDSVWWVQLAKVDVCDE